MNNPKEFLIAGKWRKGTATREVRFPYNNDLVEEVYQASDADLEEALASAAKGFEITRALPAHARSRILLNLLTQMEKNTERLAETLVLEVGKTIGVARHEIRRAKETVLEAAEEAKRINGEIIATDGTEGGTGRMAFVRRQPLGPVLGITPFNFPFSLAIHKLAPAVAAGNSFILKPPTATPLTGLILGEMLLEAGFPPEAISVVTCAGSKAEKLVSDPRIKFLSFTGSSEVGWHLKSISGRARTGLELGGNAATIVHEDANIDYAVERIANGGFSNAGQNCIAVQRVLLHRPIYDETLAKLLERISKLKVGDPRDPSTDVGPMIDLGAAADVYLKVQEAVAQGAEILLGGRCEGTMFYPTVIGNTTPEMKVNRDELFAPVITVMPYDDFDEALTQANNTDYGLQGGLFTQNMNRILNAFEKIEVGGLQINDSSSFRVDQTPYGGVKGSGVGREGPRFAIEEMTEMKLMIINRMGGKE
jgi:acyl-CoA reductase-like NAD-dependent aldehyde dehydrogenase